MKRKRIIAAGVVAVCVAGMMVTGCGSSRKSVNYNIDDYGTGSGNDNTTTGEGISQYKDIEKWNDNWTVEGKDGATISIQIDSKVKIPDVSQMNTVECSYVEFTSEFKEKFLESFFGDEQIYYFDAPRRPKSMLEYSIESLTDTIEQFKDNMDRYDDYWAPKVQQQIDDYQKELEQCQTNLNTASDSYIAIEDYDSYSFAGEIDGIMYEVDFEEYIPQIVGQQRYYRNIAITPINLIDIMPSDFGGCEWVGANQRSQYSETSTLSNSCKYTVDESIKLAEDFLTKLGMDDLDYMSCYHLGWFGGTNVNDYSSSTDKEENNGYILYFGRAIDGDNNIYPTGLNTTNLWNDSGEEDYGDDEQHTAVIVTDQGAVIANIGNYYKLNSQTKDTGLISFDSLKNICRDEITKRGPLYKDGNFDDNNLKYVSTELQYMKLQKSADSLDFSYIPVWHMTAFRFSDYDLYVNAIDGSIIDVTGIDKQLEGVEK